MGRRVTAWILCWSLMVLLWPSVSVFRPAAAPSGSAPLSTLALPPCCCTPGMCHMAGCPGNPMLSATASGKAGSCAFSPCSHGAATVSLKLIPTILSPSRATLPDGVAKQLPLPRPTFSLYSRPITPREKPPCMV
ncbi:MAG TPA: hypothetical protein VKU00_20540 [Chthonomonadaceae bacterium]|nr:hypothetical protein [Chthonomonadaceae bacterium]